MPTSSIRLPRAATFAKWPLAKRTALFARWLKAQPRRKRYNYNSLTSCALGRFAQAIGRVSTGTGGGWTIAMSSYYINVFSPGPGPLANALSHSVTFGQASDAFQAALKSV